MGKPFSLEITAIPQTLAFASVIDVTTIKKYIYNNIEKPFLIVGSGGSLAVAQVCALLINHLGGYAQTVTPYELMSFSKSLHKTNVIFFTASGGNPDIINAYIFCKQMEVNSSFIICLTLNSKLVTTAKSKFYDTNYFELSLPNGKDGFLAVNSTLCAIMLLKKVINEKVSYFNWSYLPEEVYKCLQTESIIALGGRWSLPVVSDFESKCTEAGLINVMPADFRNFAHGRHHWLAKHPATSVICFVTDNELDIAQKTLHILPANIKNCIISTKYVGINATIDLLIQMFLLVQYLGEVKGIDPGKPGVPQYGSRLYRLNYRLPYEALQAGLLEKNIVARMVKRKKAVLPGLEVNIIENAAYEYLNALAKASFKSIVLDYDNTIISENNEIDVIYQDCISYIKYKLVDGTASWSEDNKESNTFAEHENKWGKTLDRPIIYIISSQTVTGETLTESDGNYVIDLDLDPIKSVQRYKKQMISISNLEDEPTFHSVHVRFTLDGDLNLNKFEVKEAYTVYVFGKNNSTATLTQEFYRESDEQIPGLHDNYKY